jgi:hypothetical protein
MLSVLMWAVGLVPLWILMVIDGIGNYSALASPWELGYVAALVPGVIWAATGFVALIRLLVLISTAAHRDRWRRFTLFAVFGWLLVVIAYGLVTGLPQGGGGILYLLLFLLLPTACTSHVLYLSRRLLRASTIRDDVADESASDAA